MSKQIVDVYVDNRIDFEQEAATGTDGVLLKLGQGEYQQYRARKCDFIPRIERAGLPWGVYWQMDARYSPEGHKRAIKESYDALGFGKLGLWLACELPYYPLTDWLYSKMPYAFYKPIESVWRGIESYMHEYAGFYASISKWRLIFGQCPVVLQQEFAAKAGKWAAQYKVSKPDPWGAWGESYTGWQYQENPDYSVFDDAWFARRVGVVTPPVEPPVIVEPGLKHWAASVETQTQDEIRVTLRRA
jgi:hypothetical protein